MPSRFANALSLEQLIVLDAIERAGSFTAAAAQLGRTQGGVSYHVERLEAQLETRLFDRARRRPTWTDEGRIVLQHARRVLDAIGGLRAQAAAWSSGVESELRLAVDILVPPQALAALVAAFRDAFPSVALGIECGVGRFAADAVASGRAEVGLAGPLGRDALESRRLGTVTLVPVVAAGHPLARSGSPDVNGVVDVDEAELERHTHLLLSDGDRDRRDASEGFAGANRWRLRDARTRIAFVEAGLGWARLATWEARDALEAGRWVELRWRSQRGGRAAIPIAVVAQRQVALGLAGQWFWERASLG